MTTASSWPPYASTTPMPARPAPKAALQVQILEVLAHRAGASSTAAVRDALSSHPGADHNAVTERVYAALVALERRAMVRRCTNPSGTRPLWELASAHSPADTTRSHAMHCTHSAPVQSPAHVVLTAHTLEDRIARIETSAQAHALAEIILENWDDGVWQRWKPLATAPLAGWLYAASHIEASGRVAWILRALPHRAQWSRAARDVAHDQQLHESLRSVSRLDDRQFADVSWMLMLALFPWGCCSRTNASVPAAGGW